MKLSIPLMEGMGEWCRAQTSNVTAHDEIDQFLLLQKQLDESVPDSEKTVLERPPVDQPILKAPTQSVLDDTMVFNRSHLKLFLSDPLYRDIFAFANSAVKNELPDWLSIREIADTFHISYDRAVEMVQKLDDLGVLEISETDPSICRCAKYFYYFPDDKSFYELRNQNFSQNVNSIMNQMSLEMLHQKRGYRGLVTKALTESQVISLTEHIEKLVSDITMIPTQEKNSAIYSTCILLGKRFDQPTKVVRSAPGLKTELSSKEQDDQESSVSE